MMRSLLIKVAMLAVTLGSLVWIGSVTPIKQVAPPPAQPTTAGPVVAASSQLQNASAPVSSSATSPGQVTTVTDLPLSRPVGEPHAPATQEEPPPDPRPVHQAMARQVDLNHATASDLEALPGIGPKLAQRVIDHRVTKGPFTKVEDLRQVKGIGRKKFDRLRPHVLVTNTRSLARHKGTL